MRAVGVDGCKAGWFCLERDSSSIVSASCIASASTLIKPGSIADVIAIDIPIGLLDAGVRDCDTAARALLGPRRTSVFNAPLRPMLTAKDWHEACAIGERADGRRISKQAWAIVPKVREVDALLTRAPALRARVREVHPEVCFWAWHGEPMRSYKKTDAGHRERLTLVELHFGEGSFDAIRGAFGKSAVADDDILDSFAALWTAERIVAGTAQQLPPNPPHDELGLTMEMVY